MFFEIVKTECEQAEVFWEEYYKHVNKAHFSDGSDFDQTVMYPGELELTKWWAKIIEPIWQSKWGSSLAFGGGTNGTLYVDFTWNGSSALFPSGLLT